MFPIDKSAAGENEGQVLQKLIQLRLAAAFLGGGSCSAWWKCDFLSASGLDSTEYNFPRHPLVAAMRSSVMAAKLHHDERIGKSGTWHLFRLPTQMEAQIHQNITSAPEDLPRNILEQSAAITFLHSLAQSEIDPPDGPVQIGTPEACGTVEGISEMAKHYHAAFRAGRIILPYFAASSR